MTNEAKRSEDTVEPLVRLRIEVVGEDGDACRKLLRKLCDMIDADAAGAPGYSVSTIEGSASCDVNTLHNAGGEPCRCEILNELQKAVDTYCEWKRRNAVHLTTVPEIQGLFELASKGRGAFQVPGQCEKKDKYC